ncbi:UDP-glucuronosyl/UDP-glucosyltransferase [Sesbania bispinosa]|nr:UDP-glucuronosyl/UDP-glucosyltransferase [Sesbania bispinosa]
MKTESQDQKLHVIFLPHLTPGHMNPMVNTARVFAKHGVSATIVTTPANALTFQKVIDSDFSYGYPIRTRLIQFPAAQVGLPEGVENIKAGTSPEMLEKISLGIMMLKDQIELLFQELQPDCIVSDMFYPWTVESAAKLGIPRLYYYSSSYFSSCAAYFIKKHKPHEKLVSVTQKFSIPGLPHNIEITTLQLEEWSVGPVSAWADKVNEKEANGGHKEDLAEEPELLNWLNSKEDETVLYVSFGSLTRLPHAQLVEIAHGLENSGHNFIWVVRKKDVDEDGDSFLQDFEQRMKESNKGYIIWNWAPQLLILDHPSIGGIVTHCGWNSILESLCAGLPMITWPMFAEQFYNEKLLVDVLKIGVPVGSKQNKFWSSLGEDEVLRREEIAKAVVVLMGRDEESKEMRRRARKLGNAAKKTIEEGASSYNNLMQLIDELKSLKTSRALEKTN